MYGGCLSRKTRQTKFLCKELESGDWKIPELDKGMEVAGVFKKPSQEQRFTEPQRKMK